MMYKLTDTQLSIQKATMMDGLSDCPHSYMENDYGWV